MNLHESWWDVHKFDLLRYNDSSCEFFCIGIDALTYWFDCRQWRLCRDIIVGLESNHLVGISNKLCLGSVSL